MPKHGPGVVGAGVGEEPADVGVMLRVGGGVTEAAEGEGEVGLIGGHALQEVFCQRTVAVALGEEAEFAAQAVESGLLEVRVESGEGFGG